MSPLDSVVDDVLLPITDVQTGDKIYIRNSYPGNAYRLLFDITITEYIQFTSSMDNAFASVTDPDTAWYEPQASDSEIIPRVIASSKGEYIKVGTASVEGVDVQYAESDTGIISGLSAVFAEGRTYIPSTERTMVWGGISRNISSISRAGSIFTFIFDDGSSAEISDTHTACKIDVEGTAQPSYVDVYRLTVKDPEGMIGTPDQPIPNIYADLYTGGLSRQCFAGYLERASITKPLAVIGAYHMCPRLRWSMLAGSGAIYDSDVRLYSNGFIEISIPLSLSDDTMCKILLPFLFTGDVGVLASGYRDDMLPSDDTPPGMSGTGHDAQFDATYDGAEAVSGSSHQWSRIIGMNDYNSINGCIRVSGYLQETQFNDIMAHSGDLEYLFTS